MQKQGEWSQRKVWLGCLAPAGLAVLLRLSAELVPADQPWGHMVHSICLMAPRWLALLTPLMCLRVAWGSGARALPGAIALLALPLIGLPGWDSGRPGVRVLVANVNAYTGQPVGLSEAIAALEPDVVVQVEARSRSIPGMVTVAHNFDRRLERPSHATAVFCRPPTVCEGLITQEIGSRTKFMPIGLVRVDERFCVVGIHGPPPVPIDASGLQPYMDRVARSIRSGRMAEDWGPCREGDPALVAGDMNAVPGSWAARTLAPTGLRDLLKYQGLFAISWPFGGDTLNLPTLQLDHMYAGALVVDDVHMVSLPGADHRGVWGRVSLPEAPASPLR
jgi:endonuclease/exonuclease/phosphatase (EEP) superfamily protein YafD